MTDTFPITSESLRSLKKIQDETIKRAKVSRYVSIISEYIIRHAKMSDETVYIYTDGIMYDIINILNDVLDGLKVNFPDCIIRVAKTFTDRDGKEEEATISSIAMEMTRRRFNLKDSIIVDWSKR